MENVWDWSTFFLIILLLFISVFFLINYDKKNRVTTLILGLLPTFLLLSLRGESVGGDLVRYAENIRRISIVGLEPMDFFLEPLMNVVYVISGYCGGISFFIWFTTAITYLFVFFALKKLHNEGKKVTAIFLMFFACVCIRACSMVANGIALAISLFAYTYLFSKKINKKAYWILSVVAMAFHISAIINIPIYLLCMKKIRIKQSVILRVSFLLLCIFCCFLISKNLFYGIISSISDGEYARFMTQSSFGLGNTLVRVPLILITLYIYRYINIGEKKDLQMLIWLLLFDLVISQLKYFHQDFERFTMYSGLGILFAIPQIVKVFEKRYYKFVKIAYPVFIGIFVTMYIVRWKLCIMPYVTRW